MCANCGFPPAPGHWTDDRRSQRLRPHSRPLPRARSLAPVLACYGLTVHDDGSSVPFQYWPTELAMQVIVNTLTSFGRRLSVSSAGLSIRSNPVCPRGDDALTTEPHEGRMRLTILAAFSAKVEPPALRHRSTMACAECEGGRQQSRRHAGR